MMRILRNSILLLLTFILAFTIPSLVLIQSISSTILKPYNTITYFEKSEIYQELENILEKDFMENGNFSSAKPENALTTKILNSIIERQITNSSISYIMNEVNKSTWNYILGKSSLIEPVSMKWINDSMLALFDQEIENFSQEAGLPADMLKKDIIKYAENSFPKYFNYMVAFNIQVEDMDNIKQTYTKIRQILFFLYIVLITSLIIGLLTSGGLKRIIKWLSTNLIIGGFLSLVPVGIMLIFKDDLYAKIGFDGLLNNFNENFGKLFNLIINDILIHITIISLLLILFGFVLLVLKVIIQKDDKEKTGIILDE